MFYSFSKSFNETKNVYSYEIEANFEAPLGRASFTTMKEAYEAAINDCILTRTRLYTAIQSVEAEYDELMNTLTKLIEREKK